MPVRRLSAVGADAHAFRLALLAVAHEHVDVVVVVAWHEIVGGRREDHEAAASRDGGRIDGRGRRDAGGRLVEELVPALLAVPHEDAAQPARGVPVDQVIRFGQVGDQAAIDIQAAHGAELGVRDAARADAHELRLRAPCHGHCRDHQGREASGPGCQRDTSREAIPAGHRSPPIDRRRSIRTRFCTTIPVDEVASCDPQVATVTVHASTSTFVALVRR